MITKPIPHDHRADAKPNFRAWNTDSNAHAVSLGIRKGEKTYRVTYTHAPEETHIITGKELEKIGRFV